MTSQILPPAFDCGLCDIIHPCHCDRVRHGCPVCLPPIPVVLANVLAHEIAQLAPQSDYGKALGEPPVVVRMRLPRSA